MKALLLFTTLLVSLSPYAAQNELKIYNWFDYIPKDVITDFEQESGTKVIYDAYDSQEQLEAKLLTGASGYDLAFSGAVGIDRLISSGALQKLDTASLSNLSNIDPQFMQLERSVGDRANEYAIPYLWGTNIIGYNKEAVKAATGKDTISTWDDLLNPAAMEKLSACGVVFLDSPSEIMPIMLTYLGLPPESTSKDDYKKAADYLKTIRPFVRYLNSSSFMADIANGEICVAVAWDGALAVSAANAAKAGKDYTIALSLPPEGAPVWFDSMVIPKGATNTAAAHQFIDFLMRPDIIARCSNGAMYANPNLKATPMVDASLRNDPAIYPSAEVTARLYPLQALPLKAEQIRTRTWVNFKTNR